MSSKVLCLYPVVLVIHRQWNRVIDVLTPTWGQANRGLACGKKGGNINVFLWCSQQGIRRFPLTGLKQFLLFFSLRFIPASLVILIHIAFLCFPRVWGFYPFSLFQFSLFQIFNLCFSLSLFSFRIISILKFHFNAMSLIVYYLWRNSCYVIFLVK